MAFTDDNLRGLVESGNALTMDLTPFIEREIQGSFARIPPQLLEPLRGRDGGIYALPFFFIMWFHTYNKDLFQKWASPSPSREHGRGRSLFGVGTPASPVTATVTASSTNGLRERRTPTVTPGVSLFGRTAAKCSTRLERALVQQ